MTEEKPVVTSPELVAGLKEEAKQFYEAGDQTSYLNMLREMSKLLPSNLLLKQNIVILEFQSSNSESAGEKLHSDMMEIVNVVSIGLRIHVSNIFWIDRFWFIWICFVI